MDLSCAIIDDEPWAIKLLQAYVERTPSLQLQGVYTNAVDAIVALEQEPVDLLFCDIQMPGLDGLHLAKMLGGLKTRIVFTTAFDKYAMEGWKVDALDYLLKPIAYTDFMSAVHKAITWFSREATTPSKHEDSFFVKSDYRLVRVRFDDIIYIESLKDYVKIYLGPERRSVVSLTSLRTVEAALPPTNFLRTHRSFIVNMNKVEVVERGQIIIDEKVIPISDSYREQVVAYVNNLTLASSKGEK